MLTRTDVRIVLQEYNVLLLAKLLGEELYFTRHNYLN